jgi:hypothetical protein
LVKITAKLVDREVDCQPISAATEIMDWWIKWGTGIGMSSRILRESINLDSLRVTSVTLHVDDHHTLRFEIVIQRLGTVLATHATGFNAAEG